MALTRQEAHQLIDELDAADVPTAVAVLRQLTTGTVQRNFRAFDLFDAEEDLAERSSEILRNGLSVSAEDYGNIQKPA
jgi:hypothetical protein